MIRTSTKKSDAPFARFGFVALLLALNLKTKRATTATGVLNRRPPVLWAPALHRSGLTSVDRTGWYQLHKRKSSANIPCNQRKSPLAGPEGVASALVRPSFQDGFNVEELQQRPG